MLPPPLVALSPGDLAEGTVREFRARARAALDGGLRGLLLREPGLADRAYLDLLCELAQDVAARDGWIAAHDRPHLAHQLREVAPHRGLDLVRRALDTAELPPRVFNPTHVNRRKALFDEACALAQRGCTIDVSAFPVADDEDAWSAAGALACYLDAGLPPERITVSSDCGGARA